MGVDPIEAFVKLSGTNWAEVIVTPGSLTCLRLSQFVWASSVAGSTMRVDKEIGRMSISETFETFYVISGVIKFDPQPLCPFTLG